MYDAGMRWALPMLVLAAACGARAASVPVAAGPDGEAVRQSKAVAAEILRAVRSADADDVLSMAGEGLLVLGPRAQDAYGSRTDAVLALRETLDPRRKPKLDSGGAVVVAGPGGRAAYLVDRLRLGRKPLVATALLDGHDGIWRLVALQLSHSQAAPVSPASKQDASAAPEGSTISWVITGRRNPFSSKRQTP